MSRIYVVTIGETERLIEAYSQHQAVMHVAAGMISARAAKVADVARLMEAGVKVEGAKKEEPSA